MPKKKVKTPSDSDIFPALLPVEDETPRAYEAFLAYIELGPSRALARLAEQKRMVHGKEKHIYAPQRTLETWSYTYKWQARLSDYLKQLAGFQSAKARERLTIAQDRHWSHFEELDNRVTEMLREYSRLKTVAHTRQPDPRDPTGKTMIETITMRVNTVDLERLIRASGLLSKDLQAVLGGNQSGTITLNTPTGANSGGFKAYIGFTPDQWPDPDVIPKAQNEQEPPADDNEP